MATELRILLNIVAYVSLGKGVDRSRITMSLSAPSQELSIRQRRLSTSLCIRKRNEKNYY